MLKKEKMSSTSKQAKRKKIELENEKLILDTWQKNSEQGKLKYALRFGLFTWGFPTFIIYSIIMIAFNLIIKTSIKYSLYQAVLALFFFVVFGMVYGVVLWNKNEKIYKKKFPYSKKKKIS